ncbi:MAG: response regulator [Alphaproteobacteria bacterium]|nr:response regulator [Alphaproteobacteria bacterium]
MALFERVSMLVAEDQDFLRSLLRNVLFAAGFRNVKSVVNGQEAIDYLAGMRNPGRATTTMSSIDIVITDVFMEPVNGLELLRWIRQDQRSPNRFVPVLMLSAAADTEIVRQSRDLGVTEFVAKPFSVNSLIEKILAICERPRPYILVPTYFGPDRRRQNMGAAGNAKDRRQPERQVRKFNSAIKNLNLVEGQTWLFDLPNALKSKLDTSATGGIADLTKELAQAQQTMERAEVDAKRWFNEMVDRLGNMLAALQDEASEKPIVIKNIHGLAHELRGAGGIFGFPLVTQFGKSLYQWTDEAVDLRKETFDMVRAHIEVIRITVRQGIRTDNDRIAIEIKSILDKAIRKFEGHAA